MEKGRQKVNHCNYLSNESCNKINYELNNEKFMILTIHIETFTICKKKHTQNVNSGEFIRL